MLGAVFHQNRKPRSTEKEGKKEDDEQENEREGDWSRASTRIVPLSPESIGLANSPWRLSQVS